MNHYELMTCFIMFFLNLALTVLIFFFSEKKANDNHSELRVYIADLEEKVRRLQYKIDQRDVK